MSETETIEASVQPVFELSMKYEAGLARVTPERETHSGEYLGSGRGAISGGGLEGAVQWDLFEVVGETRCEMEFAGVVETASGERVRLETSGYGFVADPEHRPDSWTVTHAVRFEPESAELDWLRGLGASMHGVFDMSTFEHRYQIYAALPEGR